jgi:ectoine hydroxylase-related dioxygenase (phytanoyl-CoA dioxygenase family)
VRPCGGGTLVLTGSHRLVAPYLGRSEAFRMPSVRAALSAHPWLRGLREPGDGGDRIRRYMKDGTVVDGVPLRVVELTGEPGDVIPMHRDRFHAAAPNRLTEPGMTPTGMADPNRSQQQPPRTRSPGAPEHKQTRTSSHRH